MRGCVVTFIRGIIHGLGFTMVILAAVFLAWAGDVITVDKDGVPKFRVSEAGKVTVGATESYVNLVIRNNSGAPNNKVEITADVLTVEGIRLEGVNTSADIALSGAGGLDSGVEAANAWYYVWVITDNDGSSTNGLLSASSTSPTIPAGFTKRRRVGTVRNTSSNFLPFSQEGNFVMYHTAQDVVSAGNVTSYTDADCSPYIPPTSMLGYFAAGVLATYTSAGREVDLEVRAKGSIGNFQLRCGARVQVANQYVREWTWGFCPTDANQFVQWHLINTCTTFGGYLQVFGYIDRI